jgi:DNA processing protein
MVEGDYTSGAMITAKFANDQNREVFAIPGRIDCPNSRGAHWLIKNGAKLVETAGDILDECNQIAILPNLTKEERWFYDCISHEPITIDELYLKVGNSVFSLLTALEMKGLIKQICGKVVRAG